MTWDEFYEKIEEGTKIGIAEVETLNDMEDSEEITDAICTLFDTDRNVAMHLLHKALSFGVRFSGEELYDLSEYCHEDVFRKALFQSADAFYDSDLEAVASCMDEELVMEVAFRFNLKFPDYCDQWGIFYQHFRKWDRQVAIQRAFLLCDYWDAEEVVEVAGELFASDIRGASLFIRRALSYGTTFDTVQLKELAALCDRHTVGTATVASGEWFDAEDLEELRGVVDEGALLEVAKRKRIHPPKNMQRGGTFLNQDDYKDLVEAAIITADNALECFVTLYQQLDQVRTVSYIDLFSEHKAPSVLKYIGLAEVEQAIPIIQEVVNELNVRLTELGMQNVPFAHPGRIASLADVCHDCLVLDWASARTIDKMMRKVRKKASQIEYIRNELVNIYNT